jgi:hypothetical protein
MTTRMGLYEVARIVHFLGLIALFGFFVIHARAGPRLRRANTVHEIRTWLGMLEAARPMFHGGVGMLLLSGIVMAGLRWRGNLPFVTIGMVTLMVGWIFAGLVSRRHVRAIRAALPDGEGPLPVDLSRLIQTRGAWAAMMSTNGAAMAVLLIMTIKPGWLASVGAVAALSALGGIVGARGGPR